jgi:hypothetical protein
LFREFLSLVHFLTNELFIGLFVCLLVGWLVGWLDCLGWSESCSWTQNAETSKTFPLQWHNSHYETQTKEIWSSSQTQSQATHCPRCWRFDSIFPCSLCFCQSSYFFFVMFINSHLHCVCCCCCCCCFLFHLEDRKNFIVRSQTDGEFLFVSEDDKHTWVQMINLAIKQLNSTPVELTALKGFY